MEGSFAGIQSILPSAFFVVFFFFVFTFAYLSLWVLVLLLKEVCQIFFTLSLSFKRISIQKPILIVVLSRA